ncbi:MAG: tRNA epoxyqueuosine(34) reductase QueG [Saprospiraceae bacterium]|nr:tRNA epoxyqueuosine(34) reductase QueG [Saprospiraceae bacterium]
MTPAQTSQWIKQKAQELGFVHAGISKVRKLDEESDRLQDWLSKGFHGDMEYMARNQSLRLDPSQLVPGAQSVISLAYNYYQPMPHKEGLPKISMYARGRDYHKILKKKLKIFWKIIQSELDHEVTGRYFVDSAPVMERQWAVLGGLGWQGKNTLLINPRSGSYFFLAEIISSLDLAEDQAIADHCGTCTRCIDACPTKAIVPGGYVLKADQCISYLTIETKKDIPESLREQMGDWVFGCDICQQVCPWNRFSTPHGDIDLLPLTNFESWSAQDWNQLDQQQFDTHFGHTPVKRAGLDKLQRSIKSQQENKNVKGGS